MRAGRLERLEVLDRQLAIARAAGDDHRSGAGALAIRQRQLEKPGLRRFECIDLGRDDHLGAELLRLIVGAAHQGHAADAGRKSEIVLDPCRGAGLAAE